MKNKETPITQLILGYISIFGLYYFIYKIGQLSEWTFNNSSRYSDAYTFSLWFIPIVILPLIITLLISFFKVTNFLLKKTKTSSKKFIIFASIYLMFSSLLFLNISFAIQHSLQYLYISVFCPDCKKITVEKILANYKNDDISNEVKNYLSIWDELLNANTEKKLKKALVKSIINSDCMLYRFRQYDSENALKNMFSVQDNIIKSFSSDSIKYIKVHTLEKTYAIGYVNDNIDNYISKKTDVYHYNKQEESICNYHKSTEVIFQKLLLEPNFRRIYDDIKL